MAKITLSDAEVRIALAKALSEQTQYVFGTFNPEECFFTVTKSSGEVIEDKIKTVTFSGLTFAIGGEK